MRNDRTDAGAPSPANARMERWKSRIVRDLVIVGVLAVIFRFVVPELVPGEIPEFRSPLDPHPSETAAAEPTDTSKPIK